MHKPISLPHLFSRATLLALILGLATSIHAGEARVRTLEQELLGADRVQLLFSVTATGAVEASISGTLIMRGDDEVSLDASGRFAGEQVELKLATMAGELHYGRKSDPASSTIPAAIKPAMVYGLVRMGILHNLARLTAGQPPDHADGGAAEWVVIDDFSEPEELATSFAITVAGRPSGTATLIFDESRLLRREQTVEFPGGSMTVVEEYAALQIR